MRTARRAFVLLTLIAVRLAADASPHPLGEPQPIDGSALGPEWQTLVNQLSATAAVQAAFTERRWFAFRRAPVELKGQLRYARDHGLSLHYTSPEERMAIIDDRGMLLRDERGRTRTAPSDATVTVQSLLDVMRFDLPALDNQFYLRGARQGGKWRLELEPRARLDRRAARSIVVTGTNHRVETISLTLFSGQQIEVSIRNARTDVAFTEAQRRKFFR